MGKSLHVVLVDDDEDEFFLIKEMIHNAPRQGAYDGIKLEWISNCDEAAIAYKECRFDIYLVDYYLGSCNGLDFLREVAGCGCQSPVILLTGQSGYDIDMAAMQLSASDYLIKGELTYSLLERTIRYALERKLVEKDLSGLLEERTRDLELLEKHAKELNELNKATACLLKTLDLNTLMGQILDSAQEAVDTADQSCLYLTDQPGSALHKLPYAEFSDSRIQKMDWNSYPAHPLYCVYQGESLLIRDMAKERPDFILNQDVSHTEQLKSLISAPLMLEGKSYGALSLGAARQDAFDESDLQLLTSFANTATSAIHNAILHAEVENLATSDPLTGQLNRRALFEQGQKEVDRFQRYGLPLSLIIFDMDNFKLVNDTYGHDVGDQVLTAAVTRCASIIRRVDILGRYGGDEFVIILPGAEMGKAVGIAERIRDSLSETPIQSTAGSVNVSISAGVAAASKEILSLSALIRCDDQALYRAKQGGRNRICTAGSSAYPEGSGNKNIL